jgi:hypothetical protein
VWCRLLHPRLGTIRAESHGELVVIEMVYVCCNGERPWPERTGVGRRSVVAQGSEVMEARPGAGGKMRK